MARPPTQTKTAIAKDVARLDLVIDRVQASDRDVLLKRSILRRLQWVKLALARELVQARRS